MNKTLVFCFLLTISMLGKSQSLSQMSFGTDSTLEIATWNIEHFAKRGQTTIDSVKSIINALEIDVWGLQEIDDISELNSVVNQLPDYGVATGTGTQRGLAFVYNKNVIQRPKIYRIYESSAYSSPFPRRPLVLEFIHNNQLYYVINNHFKCCGDGTLDQTNSGDEEMRRFLASKLLKQWVDSLHSGSKVLIIGDLNDILTDAKVNNVFQNYLNDTANYWVADMGIEKGVSSNWSYPSWPSHLDHIITTNEVREVFENIGSAVECIRPDDYLSGGWWKYDNTISDHRPVALKLSYYSQIIDTTTDTVDVSLQNLEKDIVLKIYPNPVKNNLNLDFLNKQDFTFQIINMGGKIVESGILGFTQSKFQINVSDYSEGNYYLKIFSNGVIVQEHKFLKIK